MTLAKKLGLSEKQGKYIIKDYETRGVYTSRELSIKLAKIFEIESKYFSDDYFEFIDKASTLLKNSDKNLKEILR
ncbi:hypothetical protein SAMN02745163_02877 [Clostridium cavendishii DSM 21758]|uniref:Uncharacterized protein n=1 Tax=Clostridium cavendishii DSM 21758 TaxID=1121302 RepID=A0A1M6NDQ4_9CLOT|nr:hypothetical protein [Clostridium cavendishii]SHJ93882.1 hypothetical protein SAMN02745163_02877 [Clostridium cavendishii DSM 21758]